MHTITQDCIVAPIRRVWARCPYLGDLNEGFVTIRACTHDKNMYAHAGIDAAKDQAKIEASSKEAPGGASGGKRAASKAATSRFQELLAQPRFKGLLKVGGAASKARWGSGSQRSLGLQNKTWLDEVR